jgi:Protein of unknown function (DUF3703)
MKFYWKMPNGLKPFYHSEFAEYQKNMTHNNLQMAWYHLERAHILGQPWAVEHSEVHWKMLRFGLKIKNWNEIRGQILRLIFGGVKSFVGKIPTGNTGGANVPPLLVMDIPEDLKVILKKYKGKTI